MHTKVEESINMMGNDGKGTFLDQTQSGKIMLEDEKNTSELSVRGSGWSCLGYCTTIKVTKTTPQKCLRGKDKTFFFKFRTIGHINEYNGNQFNYMITEPQDLCLIIEKIQRWIKYELSSCPQKPAPSIR